jgi:hypothetical protein
MFRLVIAHFRQMYLLTRIESMRRITVEEYKENEIVKDDQLQGGEEAFLLFMQALSCPCG